MAAKSSPARNTALEEEVDRRLARAGQRWTKGRRSVVDAMAKAKAPMSVPDVQSAVGSAVPLSSLYRIISDLVDAKVLFKLEFAQGFARFELDEELAEHHHHLVCTECGSVTDLELADLELAIETTAKSIKRRNSFVVTAHRVDFFGRCGECAEPSKSRR